MSSLDPIVPLLKIMTTDCADEPTPSGIRAACGSAENHI